MVTSHHSWGPPYILLLLIYIYTLLLIISPGVDINDLDTDIITKASLSIPEVTFKLSPDDLLLLHWVYTVSSIIRLTDHYYI